jgi:hypothetical protein
MAQQTLSLIISAIDRATGPINKIRNSINGLGGGADKAGQQAGGLSNAIAFGMVKAQAAIGAVTMGYQQLTSAIAESTDLQIQNMSAAQTLSTLTGQTFDASAGFIDQLNANLAKSAAALPGVTKDYTAFARTVSDNVALAFQGADGTIQDMDKFRGALEGVSESFGVLAASEKVPIQNAGLAFSRLMGGGTLNSVRILEFFEGKNQGLFNELRKRLDEAGATDFADLDIASRFKILDESAKKFVTDDFKGRAADTVDGLWQSFMSGLTDPMGGLFGLMRDLNTSTPQVESAFNSFNGLLQTLIGDNGLTSTLGELLKSMGLTSDPMQVLSDAFQWLDKQAKRLNGFLSGAEANVQAITFENLGAQLSRFVNFAQGRILQFLQGPALDNVGEVIAQIVNAATGAIVAVISGADAGQTSSVVGTALTVIIREIADVLANLSWQSWAVIISAALAPIIVGAAVKGLGLMLSKAIGTALIAAVGSPLFAAAAIKITTAIVAFFSAIAALPAALVAVAGALTLASIQVFVTRWDEIMALYKSFFTDIAQIFRGGAEVAIGVLTGNLGLIQQGMQNLVDGVLGWINQARDTWAIITNGETTAEKRNLANTDRFTRQIEAGGGRVNADGSVTGPTPNGAAGYIPNAASGFMGLLTAAARERRAMPAGAGLLVANTSETVLTREQAGAVGGALASKGGGNTFNISMTVNGAGESPDTLAQRVVNLLQIQLDEHLQGSLI